VWKESLDAARDHIIALGQVVHAASLLHDQFYHVFSVVVSLERLGVDLENNEHPTRILNWARYHWHALAIWHSVQSDAQQRTMTINAISTLPTTLNLKGAVRRLDWAKKAAERLAEYRNLIGHHPIMFRYKSGKQGQRGKLVPVFGGHSLRPINKLRFELIGGLRFWRTLRDDLLDLSQYVEAISKQVQRLDSESQKATLVGVPNTWPGRPRLRSLPRLRAIARSIDEAARRPRQHIRRKPSHPKS
jgi:hypothetical protein